MNSIILSPKSFGSGVKRHSMQAAVLVELAITLPLMLFFVGSMIVMGTTIHGVNLSLDAARHAARSGGALAYFFSTPGTIGDPFSSNCAPAVLADNLSVLPLAPTLASETVRMACRYVQALSNNPQQFTFGVTFTNAQEGGVTGTLVTVQGSNQSIVGTFLLATSTAPILPQASFLMDGQ